MRIFGAYRNLRLSNQLLGWFLVIALVPFLVITFLTYRNAVAELENEATQNLLAVAQRQARQIESYGDERQKDITTLSHAYEIASTLEQARRGGLKPGGDARLKELLRAYGELGIYNDFFLIAPDGQIVVSGEELVSVGTNVHSEIWKGTELQRTFDRSMTLLGTEMSDFEYSPDLDEAGAYLGTPVFQSGHLAGALILRMGTADIFRVLEDRTGLGNTGETMVGRLANQKVLYVAPLLHDRNAAFRRTAALGSKEAFAMQKALSGQKGEGTVSDYRDQPVLAAWWYLPFFRWGIVVKKDRSEAFEPIRRLQLLFAAVGLCTCVLVAFAGVRVARSISKPIEKLTQATELMQQGKLDTRIEIDAGNEIGVLARSYNQMAARLSEIIANLDARVADRTRELGERNKDLEKTLEKLHEAQAQIVMQEKMASLGGLTAGIAHEIKNPLNFVTNFSELSMDLIRELKEELQKRPESFDPKAMALMQDLLGDLEQNARKINEHGKRADSIVQNMLLHSRGTPGERRPTDINALLDESVGLAYHGLRAKDPSFNITIEKDYDPAIGIVSVVPQDISRVFLNIVNNGCYSAHQKKKALGNSFSPTVRVQSRKEGGYCEIRIRDNGKGIPQEMVDKIYNPFFTTKPAGEGTGLGLSLSYETVVTGHRGELRVETEEGSFAEFIIRLPMNAV
jgi:two-component system NtrC family sensor kinase